MGSDRTRPRNVLGAPLLTAILAALGSLLLLAPRAEGAAASAPSQSRVASHASRPFATGYVLVGLDGTVVNFGDVGYSGDLPDLGISVNNIVGASPT